MALLEGKGVNGASEEVKEKFLPVYMVYLIYSHFFNIENILLGINFSNSNYSHEPRAQMI